MGVVGVCTRRGCEAYHVAGEPCPPRTARGAVRPWLAVLGNWRMPVLGTLGWLAAAVFAGLGAAGWVLVVGYLLGVL